MIGSVYTVLLTTKNEARRNTINYPQKAWIKFIYLCVIISYSKPYTNIMSIIKTVYIMKRRLFCFSFFGMCNM